MGRSGAMLIHLVRAFRGRYGVFLLGAFITILVTWSLFLSSESTAPITDGYAAPPVLFRESYLLAESKIGTGVRPVPVGSIADPQRDTGLLRRVRYPGGVRREELIRYRAALGTDVRGRSILSSIVLSIKYYLLATILAAAVALPVGFVVGLAASDITGRSVAAEGARFLAGSVLELLESLPKYVVFLLVPLILADFPARGESQDIRTIYLNGFTWYLFYWIALAIGMLSVPRFGKLMIERVNALCHQEFVDAARASGLSMWTVIWKHILWYNTRYLFVTLLAGLAIEVVLVDISLSVLSAETSLSVDMFGPKLVTLGELVSASRVAFVLPGRLAHYWLWLFPLAAFMLWVAGLYRVASAYRAKYFERTQRNEGLGI